MENRIREEKKGKFARFCDDDTEVGYKLNFNLHHLNRGMYLQLILLTCELNLFFLIRWDITM